jgi:hypothetical protein
MRILVERLGQVLVTHGAIFVVDAPAFRCLPLRGILGQQSAGIAGQNPYQGGCHEKQEKAFKNAWKRHVLLYRA